ncbi:MAG: helix-turn-helix transcriptional regulator [Erysipelotrichaceae bacterium]|nr:helix-turn-helix transcriptional regulator [Erysipelotrichaceae bacterium]MCD8574603.1 helix-turn-helix transcriptional regulator [Erysipelotrichaceae bacterium]
MTNTVLDLFGRRLRQFRTQQNLTQEALAKKIGLHPNYISDVENGRRNISLRLVAKLATGLGVNIKDFF